MIKNFIILFVLIFAYKLISNIVNLIKIKYYSILYDDFVSNNSTDILKHRNHAIELFNRANISNTSYPISQPTGCNMVASGHTSLFTSFPTRDKRLILPTYTAFQNSIGVFKGRIIECFNPIYWINYILFLPKNILSYLNVSAESIFIKICQVFYWAFGIACTLFSTEIANLIKSFFAR